MGIAKVVSLRARPNDVSHLCFPVDGILGTLNARLGDSTHAFDFETFYATLAGHPTVAGDPSRLKYDVAGIEQEVGTYLLATLRGEGAKVDLTNAVNARQNLYFAKYGHISDIVQSATASYLSSSAGSKAARIATLQSLASQQWSDLKSAYTADGRTGVVRTTQSALGGTVTTETDTTSVGSMDEEGVSGQGGVPAVPAGASQELSVTLSDGQVFYDFGTSGESSTATIPV